MLSNGKSQGALQEAKPSSGDLVDRFLEGRLRQVLFGAEEELRLGRLRIEGSLGRGAMGAILSAFDPVLDRHVAIKSVLPGQHDDHGQLLREARLLAKLDHANVVSIYDVVEDNDGLYLVMEQVRGGDLRAWMGDGRPWQEVVPLFVQIAQGLAAAHALDITHCDVKPENVVVSDERPRLIDFGLARNRSDGPAHGGTRAYLAPERVAGAGGSALADQYAFFATLVESIEGQRRAVDERWEKVPSWLETVARRGLNPDPKLRFKNMEGVITALQPTPRRTKLLIASVAMLVVGLAVALVFAFQDNENQACEGSEKLLKGIWTDETRAGMKSAFADSGGAKAWGKIEDTLDRYGSDWVELRTQSCVATRIHNEQSPELLDFSMRCFDRRLLEFGGMTELFASPTEEVVAGATATVAKLNPLSACNDPVALQSMVPLPEGEEQRAHLRALQERLEDLKNLDRRGKYEDALAMSTKLIDEARALDYAPLSVEVLVLRGALQVTLNDFEAADKTLREAASAAAKARDDRKVAEVWIRVIDLLAKQGRHEEALTLEPVAVTSAERLPDNDEIQARLQNTLGGIYLAKAQYKESYAAYEKALALQHQIGSDGNPAMAPAIANFGLAKWYMGDLQGAREDLLDALDLTLANLGPDHSQVAYIRQNIADLHRQLGDLDKALPHFQEVLRIWKTSLGPEHPNLAYPLEQLAMLAKQRGDFDEAREHISEALRLREAKLGPKHPLILQSLTVAAEISIAEGTEVSLVEAETVIAKAIAILDTLGAEGKRHAVYILESRAQVAERREDWSAALRDRRQVLEIRLETLGEEHRDTGLSFGLVGRMLMKLGKLRQADVHYVKAEKVFDKQPGTPNDSAIAMMQARAGIKALQGNHAEAIAMLEEAQSQAEAAGLNRAYEVRFALVVELAAAGQKQAAQAKAQALQKALVDSGHPIAQSVASWLQK